MLSLRALFGELLFMVAAGRAAQQADLMQLQVECHSSVLSMLQAGQPAGFADLLLQRVLQLVTKERSDLQLDIAGAAWQVRPPPAVASDEAAKWCLLHEWDHSGMAAPQDFAHLPVLGCAGVR